LVLYINELEEFSRKLTDVSNQQEEKGHQKHLVERNIKQAIFDYIKTRMSYLDLIQESAFTHSSAAATSSTERMQWTRIWRDQLDVYTEQLQLLEKSLKEAVIKEKRNDIDVLHQACQELRTEIQRLQNNLSNT
jgi:hypothetical protein